ncbi:MAG TPA: hypothetical protein VF167_09625 [Longimicrobiaceae bacterium]
MKADTFAKLLVLQTLVDAEVGYLLQTRSPSLDEFREGLITRVSDLVDEIDALDAVAAARTYDAIVDFLAQIPEDDAGIVEATIRFQKAMLRTVERGMGQAERREVATWAVALHELLEEVATEYEAARSADEPPAQALSRVDALISRALSATERIHGELGTASSSELLAQVQRIAFAVRNRRASFAEVEPLVRTAQRASARYRPSPLTRIGVYVLRQVLSRDRRRRRSEPPGGVERRKRSPA